MNWLDTPAELVASDGCGVSVRRLGRPGPAPLVLVHGGGGHAGWWIDVAPILAQRHSVIVLELSGNGDSEHRHQYSAEIWAGDITTVVETLRCGPAVLVGHSLGGHICTLAAAFRPDLVAALVLIDSPVPRRFPPVTLRESRLKIYGSRDEGLANFRLRPRGGIADAERLREVADYGLRKGDGGWRWKFDPTLPRRVPPGQVETAIQQVECPIGVVFGEHSEMVDTKRVAQLEELLGRPLPTVTVARAHHHVPLDDPTATAAAVEHLLEVFNSGR